MSWQYGGMTSDFTLTFVQFLWCSVLMEYEIYEQYHLPIKHLAWDLRHGPESYIAAIEHVLILAPCGVTDIRFMEHIKCSWSTLISFALKLILQVRTLMGHICYQYMTTKYQNLQQTTVCGQELPYIDLGLLWLHHIQCKYHDRVGAEAERLDYMKNSGFTMLLLHGLEHFA